MEGQFTITWDVNDPKVSLIEKDVEEGIIRDLNKKFGKDSPITTTHGNVLEYLGIRIDYRDRGKVIMAMFKYIDIMLSELPADMQKTCWWPMKNVSHWPRLRHSSFTIWWPNYFTSANLHEKTSRQQLISFALGRNGQTQKTKRNLLRLYIT